MTGIFRPPVSGGGGASTGITALTAALAKTLSLADYATYRTPGEVTAITVPNPYAPGQPNAPVHPALLVFPSAWNGYTRWLAYTPYPGYNSQWENPCVAASNDGVTWDSPATNPIIPWPGGIMYNSDTHLFMSPDGTSTMYMVYRVRGDGSNRLYLTSTTDGKNWTAAVEILTGASGSVDFASPSIFWDSSASKWVMISHNLDAAAPWPVQRRVSTDATLTNGWSAPTTVTMAPGSGRAWWHSYHCMLPDGRVIGIAQDNNQTSGASGVLYLVESGDVGKTYVVRQAVWGANGNGKYRSCIYPVVRDGRVYLDMILSDYTAITFSYAKVSPGAMAARNAALDFVSSAIASAAFLPVNVAWADSCIRADSTTTASPATSGGSYTVVSGTWGISSNRLYPVASGKLHITTPSADHEIYATFADMTTSVQQWLIVRGVDSANCYRVGVQSPTASGIQVVTWQNIVGGAVTTSGTVGVMSRGQTLGLRAVGAMLECSVDGQVVASVVMTANYAGLLCGVQANVGANTFYKNIVVRTY